jgi:ubiquinone/menaquinone biosynthesis C-methylase UbiE
MATESARGDAYRDIIGTEDAVRHIEQERLRQQGDVYHRLATWTFDALDIGPGSAVLEVGCGGGLLLAAAAQRVGPTGRAVGVDHDPHLIAAARERIAPYPWAEAVEADAMAYAADDARFDAVHCRLVLMHQREPDAFLARMVALARPGRRVAAQEYDADGLPCYPPLPAFTEMIAAGIAAITQVGADVQAGRKLPDRFRRAGLVAVTVEAEIPFVALTDPRMEIWLAAFGAVGPLVERAGQMSAAAYEALVAEVRAAHGDAIHAGRYVRFPALVAVVGTAPKVPGG